ncbi:hypothetical protein ACIRO3_05290 [Streptomyces sp. NPDC102278]|uniref:hypothetical protein n=1 Tax=Streptomyces sp. NPDC102278 TaxID=3366152 RepID=UPI0037F31CBF
MNRHDDDRTGADSGNERPSGVSDETVEALGALSKALETTERARGHLYGFHQLTGTADFELDDAVRLLHRAGHHREAEAVRREILGRNVIPGHWTFQIIEAYNATYHRPFAELEQQIVRDLAGGRDHLFEAQLKARRRTTGHPAHTPGPKSADTD